MSVAKNTTYNLVGAVVPIALSIVTVPIYLRLVGQELYGVLAIAWLLLGYFGLFDLGLGRSTAYRIASLRAASPQARADTFWAALTVNFGMGLIGAALLFGAASYFFGHSFKVSEAIRTEILSAVPLLACAVPIATLTGVLTGAMQGREKFLETNLVSLISTTLFQLLPLAVAFWIGPNLVLILVAAILSRFAAILVLFFRCYLELCAGLPYRLNKAELPLLLKYGGWVNLTSLLGQALIMTDRFMIGSVLGAGAVTSYTVPLQLAQRIQILPGALTNAMFPRLSALRGAAKNELADVASRMLLALMSLPVLGSIFLAEPFLRLWLGNSIDSESATVARIVLIGFWINALAFVSFIRLQTSGRPDLVAKSTMVQIPVYIGALYFALTHFSFLGCAIVFATRCWVDYLILTYLAQRVIPNWLNLLFSFAVLAMGAYLASLWSILDWRWWISASALGLLLAAVGWRTLPEEIKAGPVIGRIRRTIASRL